MHISPQVFSNALHAFIQQQILPGTAGWSRWVVAGVNGTGVLSSPLVFQVMRMLGLCDDIGVDVDRMQAFFNSGFSAQPTLSVLGFPVPVDRSDGEALINFLRRQPAIPDDPAATAQPQQQPQADAQGGYTEKITPVPGQQSSFVVAPSYQQAMPTQPVPMPPHPVTQPVLQPEIDPSATVQTFPKIRPPVNQAV